MHFTVRMQCIYFEKLNTGVSVALIRRHGQHVLGDVDAQLLVQNHLVQLLVVFGVVHQHLDL